MYIRTLSGKLIKLSDIEDSQLPKKEDNYKYTSNEFYGQYRPKRVRTGKTYSPISLQKILQENYNYQLINISGYKGNRYTGYNTYRVLDDLGNKIIDGNLHDIADWMAEREED